MHNSLAALVRKVFKGERERERGRERKREREREKKRDEERKTLGKRMNV